LLCIVATVVSTTGLSAEHDRHDASLAQEQVSNLIRASQQRLMRAEAHHKKLVTKMRKQASSIFASEATGLGDAIAHYDAKLRKAEVELSRTVAEVKAGLANAASHDNGDWQSHGVTERARLEAEAGSVERTLRADERRHARLVRESVERAEGPLETAAQELGMKVGDLTSVLDEAKQGIEGRASHMGGGVTVEAPNANAMEAKAAGTKALPLAQLKKTLNLATERKRVEISVADKSLEGFLAKSAQNIAAKTKGMEEELEATQKVELQAIAGKQPSRQTVAK